ncbi:hypothetical protein V3C99_014706, partial [Haemonchus contortus]
RKFQKTMKGTPDTMDTSIFDGYLDENRGWITPERYSLPENMSSTDTTLCYPYIDDGSIVDKAEFNHTKMNARGSLPALAQFMLPALIDSSNMADSRHEPTRPRLLSRAHKQILRSAVGFREIAERAHKAGQRQVRKLKKDPPLCFIFMNRAYHKYGLKHIVLILVFLFYTMVGAFIFLVVEGPYQNGLKEQWSERIAHNRSRRVMHLMARVFNNSEYLVYIKGNTTLRLQKLFNDELASYERQLGIRWSEQRMEWDFWTALLFAGTICTTIGYGHIYPITNAGKVITMVFALFGIPLVLLVLQDIGKLLTISMKFPWFQTKRVARRILRCCTKQSLQEMREIEASERRDLDIFDLPVVVGLSLIIGWVLLCSMVMSVWDQNWTWLESFYFFFISLSTVGLGDLVPSSPRLLIIMFGFILVGLSLVSMVINLLQTKMKKTYDAGKTTHNGSPCSPVLPALLTPEKQCYVDDLMSESLTRSTQTNLSLPGVRQVVLRSDGVHWITDEAPVKSPDEVTRLVEHEGGLRVCEQIGDNNSDDDSDSTAEEMDVLLEKEENSI